MSRLRSATPTVATPFFERPAEAQGPARRLLLVSYHFPPSPAAGALRWQKFAQFAAEHGWHIDVLALDPTEVRSPDWARLEELPAGTRVYGIPRTPLLRERLIEGAWEYVKRLRSAPRSRATADTPSRPSPEGLPRVGAQPAYPRPRSGVALRTYNSLLDYASGRRWAMDAAAVAERLAQSAPYTALVTCGPPHTVHLAGHRLRRTLRLPFVMDMRDPWSLVERLADPIDCAAWRLLARRHERRLAPSAQLIVTNTEASRDAMRHRYPALASKIVTVMNGFDEEPVPKRRKDGRFVITYAGTIYLDRDPRPLFAAAARVIRSHRLEPRDFGIRLVGTVATFADTTIAALVQDAGLDGYVEIEGQRSRRDLWDVLAHATVLVSLPQDSHLAIPSKVFEYMQFSAWILAMAEPDSATGRLLEGTAAAVVGSGEVDAIAARLSDWYQRHRRGEDPPRLADDARFSRRHQARVLFEHLERVAAL